jgi:tRNA A-37 threonylcarbamoyl transferase component Bud32/tetratricopeptide (TPR) repeat protein
MMSTVFHRLGPYEILREIGRGGMAVVFLANDTRTERSVALKLVPLGTDREAREILEAEQWGAELQKKFCAISPRVPAVYEHGTESGYFFVAMEYLDGENLSDVISRGPLDAERAAATAVELCRFLEEAQRFEAVIGERNLRSLLHGDLKPRNVRITSGGQVKVLDFGIAKALSLSRKVTRNDFGSVAYLSPERLESGEVDAYADFWAVGVLLYEMIGGAPPFQAADTRRLEQLILSRRPPPSLGERCSIGLRAVVAKLLSPNAAERYESAQKIAEDLDRVTSGVTTLAEQEGWPGRAADEQPTRRTQPPPDAVDEATRRTTKAAPAVTPPAPARPIPRRTPPRVLIRRLGLLLAILLVLNELSVARAAGRVRMVVPTQELDQLEEMWLRFDQLSRRSYLRIGTFGLERSLTRRTMALADRVIADYRAPVPTVREAQWKKAQEALVRAHALAPDDRQLRAALRYCEGHLHRIDGEARKARRQTTAAQHEFNEAVSAFREAAELRPKWADPFLGLARTFIYGLEDVDRAADALSQAERNGFTPGARETVQLGDGYRARGDTLARTARRLTGMSQERDSLTRAAEAYQQALNLYAKAADFAGVPGSIIVAQRGLDKVQRRIAELSDMTGGTGAAPAAEERPWA